MFINYELKVSENSNKNISNYQLEYYYMYILKSSNNIELKLYDNFVFTNIFKHNALNKVKI